MTKVKAAEDFANHFVRVRPIAVGHLVDGGGEQVVADEDVCVFSEEAEDQSRHEMVHVMAFLGAAPIGVVLDQFDVKPVEAAGRADVKGAFADLFDGGDTRERQEEAEVVGKIGVAAGDGFAGVDILSLEVDAVGGENELCLGAGRGGAVAKGGQGRRDIARRAGRKVNVVGLKDTAEVGFVGCAGAQSFDSSVLVSEGREKGIRELGRVKGLLGKFGNGLFDFNGVHRKICPKVKTVSSLLLPEHE